MRAVELLKAMPIEELRRLIEESRAMTAAEIERKWVVERRARAVAATEALAESTNR